VVRVLGGSAPDNPCNAPQSPGIPLEGGVASDIRVVDGPNGPEVIKRALPKLRTRADWFADPARSSIETAALQTAAELLGPKQVPAVLWSDPEQNTFAMNLIDPSFRNWKVSLLDGLVEEKVAAQAGRQLGILHRRSGEILAIRDRFIDASNFEDLRIEPFFLRTAKRCPLLSSAILTVVEGLRSRRTALVHGDYSPKNILTNGSEIVILDWEVAHWGDPRFDVAFCLSHLLLKTFRRQADRAAFLRSARSFAIAYRAEHGSVWDGRVSPLVGALIIARLDGTSPVEYLDSVDLAAIRGHAEVLLSAHGSTIDPLDRLLSPTVDGVAERS
jgi:tRNA A-37 threonylcarbamoyl transferase component Bud32